MDYWIFKCEFCADNSKYLSIFYLKALNCYNFTAVIPISALQIKYKDIILEERKNRRKTSNDILELVETYFDLTYGYNDETEGSDA